ncbi:MAG TPA: serine protease [Cyanobacteria bacterium UBA9226]|nr:serine protease [Cyanobacteria bacterium UBA9226]
MKHPCLKKMEFPYFIYSSLVKVRRINFCHCRLPLILLIVSIGSWLIQSPIGAIPTTTSTPVVPESPELSPQELSQLAQAITVKVFSGETSGSGIIMGRAGDIYTVVTNEHVLLPGYGKPYRIQTPDGRIYPAIVLKTAKFEGNDLGLLQFQSSSLNYRVASVANSAKLVEGDEVFAAGFPFATDSAYQELIPLTDSQKNLKWNQIFKHSNLPEFTPGLAKENQLSLNREADRVFVFNTGKVSLILSKALEGGYQIGYTNDIQKGMSGGPLLNRQGKVVGINGRHAYPLWGGSYLFQDGSLPEEELQEQIVELSWAVPVEAFMLQSGQFTSPTVPVNATPAPVRVERKLPSNQLPQGWLW